MSLCVCLCLHSPSEVQGSTAGGEDGHSGWWGEAWVFGRQGEKEEEEMQDGKE